MTGLGLMGVTWEAGLEVAGECGQKLPTFFLWAMMSSLTLLESPFHIDFGMNTLDVWLGERLKRFMW